MNIKERGAGNEIIRNQKANLRFSQRNLRFKATSINTFLNETVYQIMK